MPLLTIITKDNPIIRKKSRAIDKISPEIKALAKKMLEVMYHVKGVGLAAVQVGVAKRLVVIDVTESKDNPMILINPRIVAATGEIISKEGCLSVPGVEGQVERKSKVTVKARNMKDQAISFEAEGLLAICVQHEIDHLDGKLFIDKLVPEQE